MTDSPETTSKERKAPMRPMNLLPITSQLTLVPLDQNLRGFTSFIGSWVYKGDRTFLVDVGPTATVPRLLEALELLGIKRLDAILLTHIHLDHAGGIGDFAPHFPDAPIVCHASAIRHLEDPARLWEGSLKTIGDTARAYGAMQPVHGGRLHDAARFSAHGITPILTPGHAPHHVSYLYEDCLFAGEAGGVFVDLPGQAHYIRPATPPRFFLEQNVRSLEALLPVPHKIFCYGHFGMTTDTPRLPEAHRDQLYLWADVIRDELGRYEGSAFEEQCLERLLREDPLLAPWGSLGEDVRERERGFLYNSIRGFRGYLESEGG